MTVAELRCALRGLNDDLEVVLAKDAEGNSFSPLDSITLGIYEPTTTWRGRFRDGELAVESICLNAVCFGPVN